jgi:topoisomerase IV subunit A
LADLIVGEIESDAKKYGDARRTLIEAAESVVVSQSVPDEPVTITLSKNGWIRSRQGHGLDRSQFAYKSGDAPLFVTETRTIHPIVVLDTTGRAYTIRAADIPGGRGDGVPVTTLIDLQAGARVAQALAGVPDDRYLVTGSGGYGFIATMEDMLSRVKAGKAFMTLAEGDEPLAPMRLVPELDHVAALSGNGRLLVFPLSEMREVERGRGVIVMGLDQGEKMIAVALVAREGVVVHGTNRAGKPVSTTLEGDDLAKHLLHRARKGALVARRVKPVRVEPKP